MGMVIAIWGTDGEHVYAVGTGPQFSPGRMIQRGIDGIWSDMNAPLTYDAGKQVFETSIQDIWGDNPDELFMLVTVNGNFSGWHTKILRRKVTDGVAWETMQTPTINGTFWLKKLWGTSASDLFAVGGKVNEDGWQGAVLWHFDGCGWTDLSSALPSNISFLASVHGYGSEVMAVGAVGYRTPDSTGHGVRVSSGTDLLYWTTYEDLTSNDDSAVQMPRSGTALVGGSVVTSTGLNADGDARLSTFSQGGWTEGTQFSTFSAGVYGINHVSANVYWITTESLSHPYIFRVTCQ